MTAIEAIKSVQHAINDYFGPGKLVVDGDFGPKSHAALDALKLDAKRERSQPKPVPAGTEFDARTEKNLATLDPKAQSIFRPFIKAAKEAAAALGCDYTAIGGSRTWAEQDALYAQGRTQSGPVVTNARGGSSWHNYAIALDFGVFEEGKYLDDSNPAKAEKVHKAVGALAKDYMIEWGGLWSFVDPPHFQVETGLTLKQAQDRHRKGESLL